MFGRGASHKFAFQFWQHRGIEMFISARKNGLRVLRLCAGEDLFELTLSIPASRRVLSISDLSKKLKFKKGLEIRIRFTFRLKRKKQGNKVKEAEELAEGEM